MQMRAALWGVAAGVALSLAPLELFAIVVGLLLVVLAGLAGRAWRSRAFAPLAPGFLALVLASGVVVAAGLAPLKFEDRTSVSLPTTCVGRAQLLEAVNGRAERPNRPESEEEDTFCFATKTPNVREVQRQLALRGLDLFVGKCGNGSSILFGGAPIGRPILRELERDASDR